MSNKPIRKIKNYINKFKMKQRKNLMYGHLFMDRLGLLGNIKRGGTYSGKKDDSEGIDRWYRENGLMYTNYLKSFTAVGIAYQEAKVKIKVLIRYVDRCIE